MIETLMAVSLLAVGAIGYLGIQLELARTGQQTLAQSRATIILADLVERIRSNPAAARAGHYVMDSAAILAATPAATNCSQLSTAQIPPNPCTAEAMAKQDMLQILLRVQDQLPGGSLWVDFCDGKYCLYVGWQGGGNKLCNPGPEFAFILNPDDQCLTMSLVP